MRVRLVNMEQRKDTTPGKEKSEHPVPPWKITEVLTSEMTIKAQPSRRYNRVPHVNVLYKAIIQG